MSEQPTGAGGVDDADPTRPRFTDKRRIDPVTGAVREQPVEPEGQAAPTEGSSDAAEPAPAEAGDDTGLLEAQTQAADRLADLQRLQAEFVNYRRRVDRDRLVARDQTVVAVVEALLGVLDDIELARQHGELAEGPFASIAEKLETSLSRFGWERFGAAGEVFDPAVHEALMQAASEEVGEPTVSQVLQSGHRVGERIVRAARVAVATPAA